MIVDGLVFSCFSFDFCIRREMAGEEVVFYGFFYKEGSSRVFEFKNMK